MHTKFSHHLKTDNILVPEQLDLLKWISTENDAFKLRSNYSNLLTKTSTLEEFSALDQGLSKP
jgi:hypothetical protein